MIWLISQPAGRTRSNSMAHSSDAGSCPSSAGDNYNEVLGFDVADDTIVLNPRLACPG